MSIYSIIEKIMFRFFNNQMFHRPLDNLMHNAKVVKEKYKFPCEIQQTFEIDNLDVIAHHYGCKYKDIILYFPGGAFVDPPTTLHYKFAKKSSKKLKKHIIMFQYPLFPEVDPSITTRLIRKIIKKMKLEEFYLMGDSAGANLATYLLLSFHQDNINIVNKVILISPFVDASMNTEEICLINQHDFILDKYNCYEMAKQFYSKYLNGSMYLFPKSSEFKYDTNVLVLSGGNEIFTPDTIKWTLKQKVLNVKHIVYNKVCHCFIIFPIKQARLAINNIKDFLSKEH